jgi:FAD/FMN-containing dehydrogenase
MIDRRPALIARCADPGDVVQAVNLAREQRLLVSVRCSGHNVAGYAVCDDGIVIDLSRMKAIEVSPAARTVRAGAGLNWGEVNDALQPHGLAATGGFVSLTGVSGLTLGGGLGWLVRKHGLALDNLLSAEMVLADGRLVTASASENDDLFWAIRGGGGNFGVATRLQFRLHEVGTVVGGMLFLPATPDVIASFIAEAEAAPDELSTIANVMPAPPLPFLAPEHHGRLVVMAMLVYAGDVEAGQRAVAPFRALATPLADMLRPMAYPEMYPPADKSYRPVAVARTLFTDGVERRAAETIVERIEGSSAASAVTQLRVLGGAMARVPADATAFAHRDRRVMANVVAMYQSPEERPVHEAWVADLASELSQGDAAGYPGFLGDEGPERVRAAYPGSNWERLRAIKAHYDPDNLFRLNQNIPPAPA